MRRFSSSHLLVFSSLLLLAHPARAQAAHPWRVGVSLTAPTPLVKSGEGAADSLGRVVPASSGKANLGIGVAIEASRVWPVNPDVHAELLGRLQAAPISASEGGTKWNPGHALIYDLTVRLDRDVRKDREIYGGIGLSHWSGPSGMAPFAGASSMLLAFEAGGAVRQHDGPWSATLGAHVTRFGVNDTQAMQSGYVFRFLAGVRRAY